MTQVCCARGWSLEIERGPECLFVRPRRASGESDAARSLAEQLWSLSEQNFTYRVVLELSEIRQLDSLLIEQLLWLEQQIRDHGGMLRICGLSPDNQAALVEAGLDGHFAQYCNREAAVMGWSRPLQPR